ncbi:hypothetical protein [Streptomyces nojiriensis]
MTDKDVACRRPSAGWPDDAVNFNRTEELIEEVREAPWTRTV